jgi:hypothetical protein
VEKLLSANFTNNTRLPHIFVLLAIFIIPTIACGGAAITTSPTPTSPPSLMSQILDNEETLSPSYLLGQSASIDSLQVTPVQYEITNEYTSQGGEVITPSSGATFLWVLVTVENTGDNAADPSFIFELYYRGEKTDDKTFGHVDNDPINYPSFRSEKLFPNQQIEGWIMFEVPEAINLPNAYFLVRPLVHPEYTAWHFKSD